MVRKVLKTYTVTVYRVNVIKGATLEHDEDLAIEIMQFLRRENLAYAQLAAADVEIPVQWHRDQSKMAQESAFAFAAMVQATGIDTDYALLVEILCNGDETRVRGVHFYLADQVGNLANGGLTNSHWEEFHEIQPHDRQGGCEVAKLMLRREWQRN
jgi:hypothetical protein